MPTNAKSLKYKGAVEALTKDLCAKYFKTLCEEIDLNAREIVNGRGLYEMAVDVEITRDESDPDQGIIKVWLKTVDPTQTNFLRRHYLDQSMFRPTPALKAACFKLLARIAREYRSYEYNARIEGNDQNRFWLNLHISWD